MNLFANKRKVRRMSAEIISGAGNVRIEPANDAGTPESQEYFEFHRFLKNEKRYAFWGGFAIAAMAAIIFTLGFILTSASGITFMTCQEFGEIFTCRFGGL